MGDKFGINKPHLATNKLIVFNYDRLQWCIRVRILATFS